MAKEEKKILTPEDKKREKELLEMEKQEKAEIDKMQKEKAKKRKLKEKKAKEEQKKEIKRINSLVKLPFKLLLQISVLATMFSVILLYYWLELDLKTAMIYVFLIFSLIYFGIGSIMVGVFYLLGEDKKRELMEIKRIEAEKNAIEESKRQSEENTKLQELERDIAEMKNDNSKSKDLLPEKGIINDIFAPASSNNTYDNELDLNDPYMLGGSAASLNNEFQNSFNEPNIDSVIESEMAKSTAYQSINDDSDANEMSYFDEIMSPDYNPNQAEK